MKSIPDAAQVTKTLRLDPRDLGENQINTTVLLKTQRPNGSRWRSVAATLQGLAQPSQTLPSHSGQRRASGTPAGALGSLQRRWQNARAGQRMETTEETVPSTHNRTHSTDSQTVAVHKVRMWVSMWVCARCGPRTEWTHASNPSPDAISNR